MHAAVDVQSLKERAYNLTIIHQLQVIRIQMNFYLKIKTTGHFYLSKSQGLLTAMHKVGILNFLDVHKPEKIQPSNLNDCKKVIGTTIYKNLPCS